MSPYSLALGEISGLQPAPPPRTSSNWLLVVLSILSVLLVAVPFLVYWIIYGRLCRRLFWIPFRKRKMETPADRFDIEKADFGEAGGGKSCKTGQENGPAGTWKTDVAHCSSSSSLRRGSFTLRQAQARLAKQQEAVSSSGGYEKSRKSWWELSKNWLRSQSRSQGEDSLAEQGVTRLSFSPPRQRQTESEKRPAGYSAATLPFATSRSSQDRFFSTRSRTNMAAKNSGSIKNDFSTAKTKDQNRTVLPPYFTGFDGAQDNFEAVGSLSAYYTAAAQKLGRKPATQDQSAANPTSAPYLKDIINRLHRFYGEGVSSNPAQGTSCGDERRPKLGPGGMGNVSESAQATIGGSSRMKSYYDEDEKILFLPMGINTI